jgi:hypothetical protein
MLFDDSTEKTKRKGAKTQRRKENQRIVLFCDGKTVKYSIFSMNPFKIFAPLRPGVENYPFFRGVI